MGNIGNMGDARSFKHFGNKSKPVEPSKHYLFWVYGLLVYLSAQLHEIGHWLMATLLGLNFALGFNRWQILSEATTYQKLAVLTAGPVVTLALIIAGFLVLLRMEFAAAKRIGPMLIISNSLMILIPNLISLFSGGFGDIGWIAFYLATPQYALKVPLVLALIMTTIAGIKELEPEMKETGCLLGLFFIPVLVMAAVVLLDRVTWYSYENGELLFPIWGISALTLLANGLLAVLLVVLLWILL